MIELTFFSILFQRQQLCFETILYVYPNTSAGNV